MQALVDAVAWGGRCQPGAGSGGIDWGYDLSQIATNPIIGANVVYDTHPYPYNGKQPPNWDASFGNVKAIRLW